MASTAMKSPTDVIDFLANQHEQIKSLFAQTLSASGKARETALAELRRLLAVHETAEGATAAAGMTRPTDCSSMTCAPRVPLAA